MKSKTIAPPGSAAEAGAATPSEPAVGKYKALPHTAELRARVRLHALRQALNFASHRAEVCGAEAERYAAKGSHDLAATERCAFQEARYIADEIGRLMTEADVQAAASARESRQQRLLNVGQILNGVAAQTVDDEPGTNS